MYIHKDNRELICYIAELEGLMYTHKVSEAQRKPGSVLLHCRARGAGAHT